MTSPIYNCLIFFEGLACLPGMGEWQYVSGEWFGIVFSW